jgi:hypothetical protein
MKIVIPIFQIVIYGLGMVVGLLHLTKWNELLELRISLSMGHSHGVELLLG